MREQIAETHDIADELDHARRTGNVVLTGGAFDLFHVGHLEYLEEAKYYGGTLVVHVDSDEHTGSRKDAGRPIVPLAQRAAIVAALRCVDYVISSGGAFYEEGILRQLKPDVILKTKRTQGSELAVQDQAATIRRILPHTDVVYVEPFPDISTTAVVNSVLEPLRKVTQLSPKWQSLGGTAKVAAQNGYSIPGLRIGAAAISDLGEVYTGSNISNASPSLALCAERVAIAKAVSAGVRTITSMAIYSETGIMTPCGPCRQVIHEFSDKQQPTELCIANQSETFVTSIDRLLPRPFETPRRH